jgi:hypothetical protein
MLGVQLNAARGQLLERQSITASQGAQTRTEEMPLSQQSSHVKLTL